MIVSSHMQVVLYGPANAKKGQSRTLTVTICFVHERVQRLELSVYYYEETIDWGGGNVSVINNQSYVVRPQSKTSCRISIF